MLVLGRGFLRIPTKTKAPQTQLSRDARRPALPRKLLTTTLRSDQTGGNGSNVLLRNELRRRADPECDGVPEGAGRNVSEVTEDRRGQIILVVPCISQVLAVYLS